MEMQQRLWGTGTEMLVRSMQALRKGQIGMDSYQNG
jgi:hypothetical protein